MSDNSKIEWTDASWNPIRGVKGSHHCVKVSPGCANCYAETMAARFGGQPYRKGADTLRLDEAALLQPLKWKKARRIFVCSMTDLFAEDVPDAWIDRVLAVAALCPQHTFQILTKRAARMAEYFGNTGDEPGREDLIWATAHHLLAVTLKQPRGPRGVGFPWPLPNVWLGVSVEDQQRADERIPHLLRTPAAVRWLSCEPLLGGVDLFAVPRPDNAYFMQRGEKGAIGPKTEPDDFVYECKRGLHWVVVGGESGRKARPMQIEWAESLVEQCQTAGVPVFVKQLGGMRDKRADMAQFPEGLRVREYPCVIPTK